jgi:MinD-like ATPase involved in chromosome partitioning or flagellar assembly
MRAEGSSVSDQGWQNAVLQDLGVPRAGLVTAANPAGGPASPAAPSPAPTPAPNPAPAPASAPEAPLPAPVVVTENGREPHPRPEEYAEPSRPDLAHSDLGHPDLAHPDLAFPDLAHPSLGLSPAPPAQPAPQQAQQVQPPAAPPPVPPSIPAPEAPQAPQEPQVPAQPAQWGPAGYADDLVRNKRHGDPLIRRMGRGLSRAVGASAAQDARESADLTARIRRPVPTCRRIAVTSIRGGAGKTTVAGLMATMITQIRQDRVLAADADSGLGSLPLRMGVQAELSLQDLARARPRSWDEAARFLARSRDGLWVLSNTSRGRIGVELEIEAFRAATGEMSRYFSAIVIDCGAGLLPELQRGILAEAHAQVLVTPATVDGALSARGALDWMAGNGFGGLLPRTVVTLVTHTPHEDADLERAQHMLSAGGIPVVHVPYDRHLAGGAPIDLPMTGESARNAAIRIAAEVFSRAAAG